jgi:hypothetical protein
MLTEKHHRRRLDRHVGDGCAETRSRLPTFQAGLLPNRYVLSNASVAECDGGTFGGACRRLTWETPAGFRSPQPGLALPLGLTISWSCADARRWYTNALDENNNSLINKFLAFRDRNPFLGIILTFADVRIRPKTSKNQ